MGKAEGKGELWHGHVTAVTVAPEYRRLARVSQGNGGEPCAKKCLDVTQIWASWSFLDVCQAKKLMDLLEEVSEHDYNAFFVDLFVRCGKWGVVNVADCSARNVC